MEQPLGLLPYEKWQIYYSRRVDLPLLFRSAKIGLQNSLKGIRLLSSRFSRRYDYQRAKCEDPKIISEWFSLVQKTILSYGIDPDDIYNFDETGFAMGLIATAKVITRKEFYGRRSLL